MSLSGPVPKGFNAEEADNLEDIEKQFAVKAVIHAQTYWNLLGMRRGRDLKLTKIDDEIHAHFTATFPEIDVTKKIDEDEMKSKAGKEKWRNFMMVYEKTVNDYNFGTLLRSSAKDEYEEHTTIFGMWSYSKNFDSRTNVENGDHSNEDALLCNRNSSVITLRNRLGLNDWIYEEAQANKAKS